MWSTMIDLGYAGIETEMQMNGRAVDSFRPRDGLGVTYQRGGGSSNGGTIGSSLEHRRRFSGQQEYTPGVSAGARALRIAFGDRIPCDPVEIDAR
jgi:hypothetical protein